MTLTNVDFGKAKGMFKTLAEELSVIVNDHTGSAGVYTGEEFEDLHYTKKLIYSYDEYEISIEKNEFPVWEVCVRGNLSIDLNAEKAQHVYSLLLSHVEEFLKTHDINVFISLDFYLFGDHSIFGGHRFSNAEGYKMPLALSKELKDLQDLVPFISKYFSVKDEGLTIETGKNKFRKEYTLNIVNENGAAKIGVFHDENLLLMLHSEKEVLDLATLKQEKLIELQKVKDAYIANLKTLDTSFEYDGKNGVVFFGEKATISIEYDVFKKEYLMVFLKSKVKAPSIKKLEEKLDKLVIKKTSKKLPI